MYIPSQFSATDQDEIASFLKAHPFALLVSRSNMTLDANHLPFLMLEEEGNLRLISHMAKSNPQWKELQEQEVLLVFSSPHAYISPSHYESAPNVPTWNYVAVHAYGHIRLLTDKVQGLDVIEKTILSLEPDYLPQWQNYPAEYKDRMISKIVAFELVISRIEAKKKLSQNRSESERETISNALASSTASHVQELAEWMKRNN